MNKQKYKKLNMHLKTKNESTYFILNNFKIMDELLYAILSFWLIFQAKYIY